MWNQHNGIPIHQNGGPPTHQHQQISQQINQQYLTQQPQLVQNGGQFIQQPVFLQNPVQNMQFVQNHQQIPQLIRTPQFIQNPVMQNQHLIQHQHLIQNQQFQHQPQFIQNPQIIRNGGQMIVQHPQIQPGIRSMFVPIINGQQALQFRPQIRTLNPVLPVPKQQPTVENKEADVEALEAEAAKWMENKQKKEAEKEAEKEAKKEAEQRQKKLAETTTGIPAPPPPPMDSFPTPPPPPPTHDNGNLLESNCYLDEVPTPPPGICMVKEKEEDQEMKNKEKMGKNVETEKTEKTMDTENKPEMGMIKDENPELSELPESENESEQTPIETAFGPVVNNQSPTNYQPQQRIYLPNNPLNYRNQPQQILLRPVYAPQARQVVFSRMPMNVIQQQIQRPSQVPIQNHVGFNPQYQFHAQNQASIQAPIQVPIQVPVQQQFQPPFQTTFQTPFQTLFQASFHSQPPPAPFSNKPRFITMPVPSRSTIQKNIEKIDSETQILTKNEKVSSPNTPETYDSAINSKPLNQTDSSETNAPEKLIKNKIEWRRTPKTSSKVVSTSRNSSSDSRTSESTAKRTYLPDWMVNDVERVAKKCKSNDEGLTEVLVERNDAMKFLMGRILAKVTDDEIDGIVRESLK